jgi:DNA (cytosine-5)-methyltransferase 1
MKPRLLDLFCGAGGAGMGYSRAGFEVVGVDVQPQPRYPFAFHEADAMEFPLDGFDAIHASPPCQAYSATWALHKREHPRLIEAVRDRLLAAGVPFVIENVERAPLLRESGLFGLHGIRLCGTAFGLSVVVREQRYELRRHRLFESNVMLADLSCNHRLPVIGIYGHGESKPIVGKRGYQISTAEVRRKVMDMPWANRDEIAEAIPPAYTEWIGKQLLAHLALEPAA